MNVSPDMNKNQYYYGPLENPPPRPLMAYGFQNPQFPALYQNIPRPDNGDLELARKIQQDIDQAERQQLSKDEELAALFQKVEISKVQGKANTLKQDEELARKIQEDERNILFHQEQQRSNQIKEAGEARDAELARKMQEDEKNDHENSRLVQRLMEEEKMAADQKKRKETEDRDAQLARKLFEEERKRELELKDAELARKLHDDELRYGKPQQPPRGVPWSYQDKYNHLLITHNRSCSCGGLHVNNRQHLEKMHKKFCGCDLDIQVYNYQGNNAVYSPYVNAVSNSGKKHVHGRNCCVLNHLHSMNCYCYYKQHAHTNRCCTLMHKHNEFCHCINK